MGLKKRQRPAPAAELPADADPRGQLSLELQRKLRLPRHQADQLAADLDDQDLAAGLAAVGLPAADQHLLAWLAERDDRARLARLAAGGAAHAATEPE